MTYIYRNTRFAFFFPISTSVPSGEIVTINFASVIISPFTRTEFHAREFRTSQEVVQNQSILSRSLILQYLYLAFGSSSSESSPLINITNSTNSLSKIIASSEVLIFSHISFALLIQSFLVFLVQYGDSHSALRSSTIASSTLIQFLYGIPSRIFFNSSSSSIQLIFQMIKE